MNQIEAKRLFSAWVRLCALAGCVCCVCLLWALAVCACWMVPSCGVFLRLIVPIGAVSPAEEARLQGVTVAMLITTLTTVLHFFNV